MTVAGRASIAIFTAMEENPKKRIPCMRLVLQELYRIGQGMNVTGGAKADWMRFKVEKCICEEW